MLQAANVLQDNLPVNVLSLNFISNPKTHFQFARMLPCHIVNDGTTNDNLPVTAAEQNNFVLPFI